MWKENLFAVCLFFMLYQTIKNNDLKSKQTNYVYNHTAGQQSSSLLIKRAANRPNDLRSDRDVQKTN